MAAEEAKFLGEFEKAEKKLADTLEKKRAQEEKRTKAKKIKVKS
jgi:hypothetical protein